MATPTTNITITIVVVISIGTAPSPSTSKAGRRLGNSPSTTIANTPKKKARAELRPFVVAVSWADAGASDGPSPDAGSDVEVVGGTPPDDAEAATAARRVPGRAEVEG